MAFISDAPAFIQPPSWQSWPGYGGGVYPSPTPGVPPPGGPIPTPQPHVPPPPPPLSGYMPQPPGSVPGGMGGPSGGFMGSPSPAGLSGNAPAFLSAFRGLTRSPFAQFAMQGQQPLGPQALGQPMAPLSPEDWRRRMMQGAGPEQGDPAFLG